MFLYLKPFFTAFGLVIFLIFLIQRLSIKYNLFSPSAAEDSRRIHSGKISRLGGSAVIIAFLLAIFFNQDLFTDKPLIGLIFASVVILIYGLIDDFKDLKPSCQFLFQSVAAIILMASGVKIDYVTNPFGGVFRLDIWQVCLGSEFCWPVLGMLLIFFWLLAVMNVMNWLDGIDGLASGVGLIGSFVLFFLSLTSIVNQPPLAILSAALGGALFGFLLYNIHPAKIFLGTSGSIFIGFILGALAVFSGGKIATALMILGLPFLDALWVIWWRFKNGFSIFKPDKKHLHHKLLELGFSQNQIVIFFALISVSLGISALFLQSLGKMIALFVLMGIMAMLMVWITRTMFKLR